MLKFFSVLLGIGLILWMGCGEKQPTEGDETGSIQGRVVSAADSTQGLRDIQVDAWQEGQRIASDSTDSLGNYVIEELYPGSYDVMISTPLIWADTLRNVQVKSGEVTCVPNIQVEGNIRKPNIYLYPSVTMRITVRLDFKVPGAVIQSEPHYAGSWSIWVQPGGKIDGQYDYLFYEAQMAAVPHTEEGWCVAREDLGPWFDEKLIELGFNEGESNDFIEYWMPNLPEADFYLVYPQNRSVLDSIIALDITPNPDSILRYWFYIETKDIPVEMPEPPTDSFIRQGFTVVEWGVILGE
ncbi:carboxypeptidase regulatory-like domain-containing protein [candidate division KSB1 bacterium]|nr:carboxypeptidase regulatory-like domain-containing protein [candidate division KSB1 bacterium]